MRRIFYFARFLHSMVKYKLIWNQIEHVLIHEGELYDFIPNAKDIWARDFMPFQLHNGEFLIYNYHPDYLQGKNEKYITNCRDAFIASGGREVLSSSFCHHTNLIIDGGNMIRCTDKNGIKCVIMTTKVFYENPDYSHHDIILELEECIDAEVILIPWDTNEPYGHADGMVRALSNGKLLLNCYSDFDKNLGKTIRKALENRFEIVELTYGDSFTDSSWCHINYLELMKVTLVPVAGLKSDKIAVQQIEEYTGKKCIPILMPEIIADGGALHCISWDMDIRVISDNNLAFFHPFLQQKFI